MKLLEIIKTIGSAAVQVAFPGTGSLIVAGINELLPDGSKLPATATGSDISNAVASLPADQRACLLEREFDVEIMQIKESNSTLRVMLESDASNPHSTRPKIAYQAFQVVAAVTLIVVAMWASAVINDNVKMVNTITDGWAFVAVIISPFVIWLNSYFGILKAESSDRLNAASGLPPSPASSIFNLFKGK